MQENWVFTSEIIRIENKRALVKAMGLMGRGGGKLLFSNRGDYEMWQVGQGQQNCVSL